MVSVKERVPRQRRKDQEKLFSLPTRSDLIQFYLLCWYIQYVCSEQSRIFNIDSMSTFKAFSMLGVWVGGGSVDRIEMPAAVVFSVSSSVSLPHNVKTQYRHDRCAFRSRLDHS